MFMINNVHIKKYCSVRFSIQNNYTIIMITDK